MALLFMIQFMTKSLSMRSFHSASKLKIAANSQAPISWFGVGGE